MIGIIDCNNFYASCERNFNPQLAGKPIVVMSNNDGSVIARSEEAKALGINMGIATFELEKLIKQHDIAKYSSNYTLYGDMSKRIKAIIRKFAPNVEDYSIDESFVELKGLDYFNLFDYCKTMRDNITQWSGVPVSIGVGKTKTLSKIANRIVKKLFREQGVYILDTPEKLETALRYTELTDIWGVGSRIGAKLHEKGIHTAYDLAQVPPDVAKRNFSVVLQRTILELNEVSCIPLELAPPPKENIASQKSFGIKQTELPPIAEALANYIARVAEKLRKQKYVAGGMRIWVHTDNFPKPGEPSYFPEIHTVCDVPTDYTPYLIKRGIEGLEKIFKSGYKYKRVGVMLTDLRDKSDGTQNLFYSAQREKEIELIQKIDRLNRLNGRDTVRSARQGFNDVSWKMKQEHLSPKYTTRLSDIIRVK